MIISFPFSGRANVLKSSSATFVLITPELLAVRALLISDAENTSFLEREDHTIKRYN